ncbi:MAG: hypothetical protein LUD77_00095 [Clostridiales bacterium]|nr:hypothetical protein [Clostridiales bacterium]
MDLLEYKQIEESLKYIEDYMLNKKYSDEELDNMLKDFQISDTVCDSGTNKWKLPRYYNNGCSEGQLNTIRGILLSVDYNYGKFESKLAPQKERIEKDVARDTYKGRTLEDYENLRLEAKDKIKNMEGFAEKLQILKSYGLVINEGLEKLAEYRFVKETAKNMINSGFTLTQISNYLQTDMLGIYYLANNMDRPFKPSPEEEKILKAAEGNILDEMALLGEGPKSRNVSPYSVKTWEEAAAMLKTALIGQQGSVEIYSSKPLNSNMFLGDSDVVIDIKYDMSGFYSANTVFHILMENLFPSGVCAVTNKGHMLLYSKKTKARNEMKQDERHCVYKNGVWNIND